MNTRRRSSKTRTQCRLILAELRRADGGRVGLRRLHRVSGALAVPTRISNLRKAGFRIVNEIEHHGTEKHSFYRLEN